MGLGPGLKARPPRLDLHPHPFQLFLVRVTAEMAVDPTPETLRRRGETGGNKHVVVVVGWGNPRVPCDRSREALEGGCAAAEHGERGASSLQPASPARPPGKAGTPGPAAPGHRLSGPETG